MKSKKGALTTYRHDGIDNPAAAWLAYLENTKKRNPKGLIRLRLKHKAQLDCYEWACLIADEIGLPLHMRPLFVAFSGQALRDLLGLSDDDTFAIVRKVRK